MQSRPKRRAIGNSEGVDSGKAFAESGNDSVVGKAIFLRGKNIIEDEKEKERSKGAQGEAVGSSGRRDSQLFSGGIKYIKNKLNVKMNEMRTSNALEGAGKAWAERNRC